jgi:uncharacterized protein (TIGR00730 family)
MPDATMNRKVQRICVYCGSGTGRNSVYAEAARTLGQAFAEHGVGLVYGGGSIGLMGEIARAVLDAGGHVTGIIPEFLEARELLLREVQEVDVTESMHERKQLMFDKSDAFVALPGGIGTLEELVEQLTWSQLGQHSKPIVLANIEDYWSPLLALFDRMREEDFIRRGLGLNLAVVSDVAEILPAIFDLAAKREALVAEGAIPEKF